MPPGLKQELGLGDPKSPQTNQGSTEQADKFKAAFQAAAAKINECLQYTAAHAEKSKHDPPAAKRDTTCQAYQVAFARIDPTNPAAAQGAIDQVLAGVESLKSTIESLKKAVEKAYNAWMGRQGELESITDKIREMVDWGHDKAGALQSIVETIVAKANDRAYDVALAGLDQLLPKANPLYEEYQRQKAAQEEYEPAYQALLPRLDATSASSFKKLEQKKQEIASARGQMEQAATAKDYVTALSQLKPLETKLSALEEEEELLLAKKTEYEQAKGTLDPKLGEASQCQFKSLADLDQPIVDLTNRTEAAATEEDYEQAVTLVGELSTKVDEKLARVKDLEAKKQEYESARQALDPKLQEASTCQYKSLADLDQPIADLTTRTDAAAAEEDYEQAATLVGELSTKVDEKIARVKDLEAKKSEYEAARGALDPKLAEASQCQFKSLADLDQPIVDLTTRTDTAAAEEDYEQAATLVGELSTKVDEKLARVKDLEAKRAEYESARAALDPKLKEVEGEKFDELAALDQEITDLTTQIDEAVKNDEFDKASPLLGQLSTKADEKKKQVEELKAKKDYETALKAEEANLAKADGTDPAGHFELKNNQSAYTSAKKELDGLVTVKDYKGALAKLPGVATAAKTYVNQRKAHDDYNTEYAKVKADVDYVKALRNNSPPDGAYAAELTLCGDMINQFNQGKFVEALATMNTLKGKVADLKKRVTENDKTAKPAAEAAEKEVEKLAGGKKVSELSDAEKEKLIKELKKLPADKQRKILEDLHSPSGALSAEQREIQIAMYQAMDLDSKFKEEDKKIREKYQEELQKDADLKKAMNDWNKKDKDGNPLVDAATKQKMFEKVLAAQSKAYGIDVPKVEWYAGDQGDFGGFNADTTRISLNTRYLNDPKEMIDTIIHENTHNFQDELVKKYVAGKLPKDHPMYEQAKTFAVTHHWDAYVTPDEHGKAYEKQPEEMQAWEAGGSESKKLINSAKKKPKK